VFRPLSKDDIKQIVDLQLNELAERLVNRNISINISDEAKKYIAKLGFDPESGARPVRRVIQDSIEDPLAEQLLQSGGNKAANIKVDKKGNKLVVSEIARKVKEASKK